MLPNRAVQADARNAGAAIDWAFGTADGMYGRESVSSLLRQKEGEVRRLRSNLTTSEATNAVLAEEVAKLAQEKDKLQGGTNEIDKARAEIDALQASYAAALEMLGENRDLRQIYIFQCTIQL
jgi:hypothetical protein